MDHSEGWGPSRYLTLLVVIGVHLGLVAALMMASRTQSGSPSTEQPVELLMFPPTNAPKVRPESFRPKRLSGDTALSMAPPEFDSVAPSPASDASATNGNGSGVDWKAEARRALQAYEIRNRMPQSDNSSLSGSPAEETWWPQERRRAGTPFKTASGDWIVWINSNCYQVATSAANAYTLGAMLPQTVCESRDAPPTQKTRHPATN
jgi:hypothetical protein